MTAQRHLFRTKTPWLVGSGILITVFCSSAVLAQPSSQAKPGFPRPSTQTDIPSGTQAEELEGLKARVKALEERGRGSGPNASATQPTLHDEVSQLKDDVTLLQSQQEVTDNKLNEKLLMNLYVTLAFESFTHRDAKFDASRVELFASGNLTPRLKAFTEIEFERTAKTSAGPRQGEVEVEQGWLEYTINEAFKPRFGAILVPFGRFNLEHFDPVQALTDRPIFMRRVIPVTWAEAGAGATGTFFLGNTFLGKALEELALNYQVYAINGLTNAISDTGTRDARGSFGTDNNSNKAVAGRLEFEFYRGGALGLSGYHGTLDKLGHQIRGFDVDWKFRKGPLELLGEYAFISPQGAVQNGSTTQKVPSSLQGGYAQANYYFWPEFLNDTFWGRGFLDPKFTAVFRYDFARIADDEDAGVGANREERWTIGFNYRPVPSYAFKIEYQWNHTRNETLERGNTSGVLTSVTAAF